VTAAVGIRRVRGRLAVAVAACAMLAVACGAGGASHSDTRAIRLALARWAAARTPAQACDVMSSGFRFFVGNGDYMNCVGRLTAMIGAVGQEQVAVEGMRRVGGQMAVRARVVRPRPEANRMEARGEQIYWFVWQRGAWRLNSIGDEVGLGPPCHTYPGHAC